MFFRYKEKFLYWQDINLELITHDVVCKLKKHYCYEGPFFLYHKDILHQRISKFTQVFPNYPLYFAVKSLPNIGILKELRQYRHMGLDVVSGGEIHRGLQAGFDPQSMVFAGVGKTAEEIRLAIHKKIKNIHVESLSELKKIIEIAQIEQQSIDIALRLNPDIDTPTHQYILTGTQETKFGIDSREIDEVIRLILSQNETTIQLTGLHVHLGSQIMETQPYQDALSFLCNFLEKNQELNIDHLSLGGGFGIDYSAILHDDDVQEFPLEKLATAISTHKGNQYQISLEPGRFISAPTGLLICQVLYIKPKSEYQIAITNAGMSELIRPTLYHAKHRPLNIVIDSSKKIKYDVVGPICETGDFLAKGVYLNYLQENDYLAITQTGAYASSMSSNYNSRPFVPEILADNQGNFEVIRTPQTTEDMFSNEIFI